MVLGYRLFPKQIALAGDAMRWEGVGGYSNALLECAFIGVRGPQAARDTTPSGLASATHQPACGARG